MGNIWHVDQENNMRPDVKFDPCPWCGSNSISVESSSITLEEYGEVWSAKASCHECGSGAPSMHIASWPDHPLHEEKLYVDDNDEREVVNLAVKIWNCRK